MLSMAIAQLPLVRLSVNDAALEHFLLGNAVRRGSFQPAIPWSLDAGTRLRATSLGERVFVFDAIFQTRQQLHETRHDTIVMDASSQAAISLSRATRLFYSFRIKLACTSSSKTYPICTAESSESLEMTVRL
jgi:hypothetical protein